MRSTGHDRGPQIDAETRRYGNRRDGPTAGTEAFDAAEAGGKMTAGGGFVVMLSPASVGRSISDPDAFHAYRIMTNVKRA